MISLTRKISTLAVATLLFLHAGAVIAKGGNSQTGALSASPTSSAASGAKTSSSVETVSPIDLSHSIDQVLKTRPFAWRMEREKDLPEEKKGWLAEFIESAVDGVSSWLKNVTQSIGKAVKSVWDWLTKNSSDNGAPESSGGSLDWVHFLRILLVVLIVVIGGLLIFTFVRAWRGRRKTPVIMATPISVKPDIADERTAANELPEDGWLKLASELIEQGNFRLGLRALYLASLAHLGSRQLIAIAAFKSNREYEIELRRRARAQAALQTAFGQCVVLFDRSWYGLHEVTPEILEQFKNHLTHLRAC